jgi:hypothetical protein
LNSFSLVFPHPSSLQCLWSKICGFTHRCRCHCHPAARMKADSCRAALQTQFAENWISCSTSGIMSENQWRVHHYAKQSSWSFPWECKWDFLIDGHRRVSVVWQDRLLPIFEEILIWIKTAIQTLSTG